MLEAATLAVNVDEGAFLLTEVNLPRPDSKGRHRYRFTYVNRADRLAAFKEDMGPAENFTATEFRIPGGVYDEDTGRYELLHTVGELRDMADWLRDRMPDVLPDVPPCDFLRELIVQKEEEQLWRKRASHFGPAHKVERN